MRQKTTSRITTSISAVSWIPSEAIEGLMRLPMDLGLGHYDQPPPDRIDDIEAFVANEGCRFANRLTAWADIQDGRIVASGCGGGGYLAPTRVGTGPISFGIAPVAFPELRSTEADGDRSVTFVQTAGGRTGAPFPRRAGKDRRLKMGSPTAWSTLALTLCADGACSHEIRGASAFPRHWFYNDAGELVAKSATIDFSDWTSRIHSQDTPWGDSESSVRAVACETALERTISTMIMRAGVAPEVKSFEPGEIIMSQHESASSIALVLDGIVSIDVDGRTIAESGPGSILGERSYLEGGNRTASVTAITRVKVAETIPTAIAEPELVLLGGLHRREGTKPVPHRDQPAV